MTHIKTERPRHLDCWPEHLDCGHRDYIGREVTLGGLPAKVVVNIYGHPFIAPLDESYGLVPFSWTAVFNICDNHGGRF